jgi:hypothetical protein
MSLSERDQALYEVVLMLREYRKSKPLPRRHADGLTPGQREHWGYMRGTEAGERTALYSAILRVEAMLSDKSLIENDPP